MVAARKAFASTEKISPADYVFAVIDYPTELVQAEHALRRAKFGENDIAILNGSRRSFEKHTYVPHDRHVADLFLTLMEAEDAQAFQARLLKHMSLGHAVVAVYAPGPVKFERAVRVLEFHHAHAI